MPCSEEQRSRLARISSALEGAEEEYARLFGNESFGDPLPGYCSLMGELASILTKSSLMENVAETWVLEASARLSLASSLHCHFEFKFLQLLHNLHR